jgi:hypothetical protein
MFYGVGGHGGGLEDFQDTAGVPLPHGLNQWF